MNVPMRSRKVTGLCQVPSLQCHVDGHSSSRQLTRVHGSWFGAMSKGSIFSSPGSYCTFVLV
eukprot:1331671-Amorphochlora_amoeboformis.AAC.1